MSVRDCYSQYRGDKVCTWVNVRFIGMEDRSTRLKGNRTRGLMVPEARVSEVHEIVSRALAGLIEVEPSSRECDSEAQAELDNEERRA